jgi:hypothetical protein
VVFRLTTFFAMKLITASVIGKRFIPKLGRTAIDANYQGNLFTVWCSGDETNNAALLVNAIIHEVGDKFVATSDSKTLDEKKKPIFLKGQEVTRQTQSVEFKSFAGANKAAEFAQAASAFGLSLQINMG